MPCVRRRAFAHGFRSPSAKENERFTLRSAGVSFLFLLVFLLVLRKRTPFYLAACPSFSQIRSFALRARGFRSISSGVGRIGFPDFLLMSGFLPQTQTGNSFGQVHGWTRRAIISLTMRSSSEWKVMTQSLPPGARTSQKASSAFSSCPSSSLTSIRIA